ncbi:hypothetical protein COL516b_004288 [Colletotrichum fioriniae]|nr:uncharacterized protein COL516b_004288 [Colletotrichum fioriniae]KAJ0307056.1 hypothetical protein COL516b_004288 [Colletotrichum fioriniae]
MSPNAGEKLLPNDLAFTPNDVFGTINTTPLSPREELLAARMADDNFLSNTSFSYRPPFAEHHDSTTSIGWESLRRAVEALHILEKRQSCPTTMNSCEYIGAANKCCLSNEVCVKVVDEHVGNVACCPKGAACSGAVAACPSGTTSCDAEMSGGCCIPGYVCQGVGCVPSPPPATSASPTQTVTGTGGGGGGGGGGSTGGGGGGGGAGTTVVQTITTTSVSTTTLVDGRTTTVHVTVIVTVNPGGATTRTTTTSTAPEEPSTTTPEPTTTTTGTAVPPFRPTSTDSDEPPVTSAYCPTGFYACLARAGGGCCQTGRDCATTSCPPTESTTIISNGVTVVVPLTEVPEPQATETCASGWFLCGSEGGPVPGCCPSGYECGTASCSSISPTRTGEIQKHFPNSGGSRAVVSLAAVAVSLMVALF